MTSITREISENGKSVTLAIEGRFDFSQIQTFKRAYEDIEVYPETFIVDFQRTDYIDSAALGALLMMREHVGGENARISFVNMPGHIRKIITVTKMSELFEMPS